MTDREAMKMALEALRKMTPWLHPEEKSNMKNVIEALRQALAQGEPEVSYTDIQIAELIMSDCGHSSDYKPLLDRIADRLATYRQALAQGEQEPIPAWLENDLAFKEIMKWADIYAAQTGEIYAQAALDSSKTATMAKERKTLAFVVASHTSPISEPVKERISEPLANQEPLACKHKRYSNDVTDDEATCLDCGIKGRVRFVAVDIDIQEPVAYVTDNYSRDGVNDEISSYLPVGTELYTAPPIKLDVNQELVEALKQAEESLAAFVSDHGWSARDMDIFDNVSAALAKHKEQA